MYTPNLGVWMQRDPAEEGLDLYAYVAEDPIGNTDPSGLKLVKNRVYNATNQTLRDIHNDLVNNNGYTLTYDDFVRQAKNADPNIKEGQNLNGVVKWRPCPPDKPTTAPTSQPASQPSSQPASQPATGWQFVKWKYSRYINWGNVLVQSGDFGTNELWAVCKKRDTGEMKEVLAATWGEGDAGSKGDVLSPVSEPGLSSNLDALDKLVAMKIKLEHEGINGPEKMAIALGGQYFADGGATITRDNFYSDDFMGRLLKVMSERGLGGDPQE